MSALPPPLTDSALVTLVTQLLRAARASSRVAEHRRNGSVSSDGHHGVTIDLSRRDVASIPLEVIELIKDEIERLALAHNQLTSFAAELSGLRHLRYLNLRANLLAEFPLVLTQLPSLEILDVSRNQLAALPADFGSLMSLKVLSISKNKINVLPTYIGSMTDLKVLKADHNPIVFPPAEIMEQDPTDQQLDGWLGRVKLFLTHYEEREQSTASESSSLSSVSSEEDGKDGSSLSLSPPQPSTTAAASSLPIGIPDSSSKPSGISETIQTQPEKVPSRLSAELAVPEDMTPSSLRARSASPSKRPMPQQTLSTNATAILSASASSSPTSQPRTPLSETGFQLSQAERSRSHSESTGELQTIRGTRRMGMLPPSRKSPNAATEQGGGGGGGGGGRAGGVLRTVVEQHHPRQKNQQKPAKHQRGYSHDSIITPATRSVNKMGKPTDINAATNPRNSPTEKERQPGPYFRRLSSLPELKRSTLSSARVAEAARGILYAMSTLQRPIEQYVQSAVDPNGPHHKVERALYNANIHIGSLVGALEAYEDKADTAAVEHVIDACCSCVAAFRQVLAMLQSSSKEISGAGPDVRYMRTLLLTVYGSYVEVQSSFEILKKLMTKGRPAAAREPPMPNVRGRQPVQSGSLGLRLASIPSAGLVSASPYSTPRGGAVGGPGTDYFSLPPTPGLQSLSSGVSQMSEGGFEQDEPLYGTFQAAIGAALSTLPVIEKEIKAALGQSLQPSTALKLKQVASLCVTGAEAARRLGKVRWEAIQEGDVGERRRFWEDTNRFTNLVVNIAELIKSTHQEHTFRKHTLASVGAVVRPTKDLYILMNGNSFRMYSAESTTPQPTSPPILSPTQFAFQSMTTPQTWLAATPLSAALGPAAQATLPQGMYYPSPGLGGGSVPGSRSGTLLSMVHPTVSSVLSGMGGMSLPGTPGEGPGGLGLALALGGRGMGVGGMAMKMS